MRSAIRLETNLPTESRAADEASLKESSYTPWACQDGHRLDPIGAENAAVPRLWPEDGAAPRALVEVHALVSIVSAFLWPQCGQARDAVKTAMQGILG